MEKDRYTDMRLCAQEIRTELEAFQKLAGKKYCSKSMLEPVRNRLLATPLRAYFARTVYDYLISSGSTPRFPYSSYSLSGDNILRIKIPFIFEIIITIQYLHNQILDGKSGVVNQQKIARNLLQANLLKDLLYDYIENNLPTALQTVVTRRVRQAFRFVDQGQQMEKQFNTYEQFLSESLPSPTILDEMIHPDISVFQLHEFLDSLKQQIPAEKWTFTLFYLQRIFLTCGALFKTIVQLLLDLLVVDDQIQKDVLRFASYYGLMRQLVNDNADFLPSYYQLSTKGKRPEDAQKDLHNGNITLPAIFYLQEGNQGPVFQCLHTQEDTAEDLIFEDILSSHALFKSMQQAKLLAAIAKQYLTIPSKAAYYLLDSCDIVEWNKFLYPCYKSAHYKKFKKTIWYKDMKQLIRKIPCTTPMVPESQNSGGEHINDEAHKIALSSIPMGT